PPQLYSLSLHDALPISFAGGVTEFFNISTAGDGTLTNNGNAASGNGEPGGVTRFRDGSTAGNGTFTTNGGAVSGGSGGMTQFFRSEEHTSELQSLAYLV